VNQVGKKTIIVLGCTVNRISNKNITTYSATFFTLKCRHQCSLIYDLTLDTGNSLLFSGYPPSAAAADGTVWCDTNLETVAATIRCFHRLLTVLQSTDTNCWACRWPWQLFTL